MSRPKIVWDGPTRWDWDSFRSMAARITLKGTALTDGSKPEVMECPAGHPAVLFEMRARVRGGIGHMLKTFPSHDRRPTSYYPISVYLCVTCEKFYDQQFCQKAERVIALASDSIPASEALHVKAHSAA